MTKKAYIGVNGIARKIKKGYVGIDNLSRKIKKAYIGVGGIARPFWSGGKLTYYGTITPLSQARFSLAATSIGGYALFGGGYSPVYSSVVDAYDSNLTRSTPTALTQARYNLSATSIGDYAFFGGGYSSVYSSVVDVYTVS
nr:MAG TPA: Kelch repeat [Caudoviricetes sp.]